jgi:hypothetical protein
VPKTKVAKPKGLSGGKKGVGITESVLELQKQVMASQLSPAVLSQFTAMAGKSGKKSTTFFGTSTYKTLKQLLTTYVAKQGTKSSAWRRGQVGTLDGLLESWFSKEKNSGDDSDVGRAKWAAMQWLQPKVRAEQRSLNGEKVTEPEPEPKTEPESPSWQSGTTSGRGGTGPTIGGGRGKKAPPPKEAPKEEAKEESQPTSGFYGSSVMEIEDEDEVVDKVEEKVTEQIESTTGGSLTGGGVQYGSGVSYGGGVSYQTESDKNIGKSYGGGVSYQTESDKNIGKSYGSGVQYGSGVSYGSSSVKEKKDDDSSVGEVLSASSSLDQQQGDQNSVSTSLPDDSVVEKYEEQAPKFEQKKIISGTKWSHVAEVEPNYHGEFSTGSIVLKKIYDDMLTIAKTVDKDGKRTGWTRLKEDDAVPLADDDERAAYLQEGWKWSRSTYDKFYKLVMDVFSKKSQVVPPGELEKAKEEAQDNVQEKIAEKAEEDDSAEDDEDDSEILDDDDSDEDDDDSEFDEEVKNAYGAGAVAKAYGGGYTTKGSYGNKVQYGSGFDGDDDETVGGGTKVQYEVEEQDEGTEKKKVQYGTFEGDDDDTTSVSDVEPEPEKPKEEPKAKAKEKKDHEQTSILVKAKKSDDERSKYKLKFSGGSITRGAEEGGLDTAKMMTNKSGAGFGIFVMSPNGEMYAGSHKVGIFHHSSFLGGGQTAGAGEMKVSGGKLKVLTNKSGHYLPEAWENLQVIEELRDQGVSPDSYEFIDFGKNESKTPYGSAQSYLNIINYKGFKRPT